EEARCVLEDLDADGASKATGEPAPTPTEAAPAAEQPSGAATGEAKPPAPAASPASPPVIK
ncbi:MAG: hypothetical protein HY815_10830, partial [Candidatus Riflebacteria bacterium]|nr:hypothetical protein [Candidatus Riflebacteria bacterium]